MADAQVVNITGLTDFGDQTIKNVTEIQLKTIVSDDDTSVSLGLGTDVGDNFIVATDSLVVLGETANRGNVGMGTATPRRTLDVLDASDPQLRLTHTDDTHYSEMQATATGNLLAEGSHATNFYKIARASTNAYSVYQAGASQVSDGASKGLSVGVTGTTAYIWMRGTGSNGALNIGAGGTGGLSIDADNDIVALEGTFQLKAEQDAPSAPPSGEGGIFYVKEDGIPYYISDSTAETSLVGGGGGLTYQAKTSTFTAAVDYFYGVDSNGGDVTVNLPAVSGNAGKTIDVCHKVIGNDIIFAGNASETINGATTLTVGGIAYQNITLFCTGIEWLVR